VTNKKKIIFLASYPKSGNTWLRSIISSLIYNQGNFHFDDLQKIILFSQIANFNNLKNPSFDSKGNLDFNWLSNNWINAQKNINLKKKEVVFFKTHSVRGIINNNFFTDESVCLAFIYIIRDPRDVVVSLSNHMGENIPDSLNKVLFEKNRMTSFQKVNELISTWKNNIDSWMEFKKVPRLILKYEDMINDVDKGISTIVNFLNTVTSLDIKTDNKFLESVKDSTSFNNLQSLENKYKFKEATINTKFFRKGVVGEWRQVLTQKQVKQIEEELTIPMKQLAYL
tara:strand:- start:6192 stop:7040 length:849 start_codon:yes stop_codon:yes gene_type:complete